MLMKSLSKIVLFLFISAAPLIAVEKENLNAADIRNVMEKILDQHVDEKAISPKIIKNSFQVYIDQFDPARIYLLQHEVDRFVKMSDADARQVLLQYNRNRFTKYENLDTLIQQSIYRSRKIRDNITKNLELVYEESKSDIDDTWHDSEEKRPFSKNLGELKGRIKDEVLVYISNEKKRFGGDSVTNHKKQTLEMMDKQLQHHENQYLYTDSNGHSLLPDKRENLFALHILKALARSLDSHTSFFSSNEAYDMKVRLEKGFEGIGVVLQRKPQGVLITKLIKGGPAEKSGEIKVGDQIIRVNGYDVEHESLERLVEKLRDKSEPSTKLVLRRYEDDGDTIVNVSLKREKISLEEDRVDISYDEFGDGIIGKLTLHSFYQGDNGITSEKDLRQAIKELEKIGNLKGLILDLRENSGGFLTQAVKVAGLFITNGVIVISKYSNGERKYYRDMDGKVAFDGPLIVLTSRATASAAEIVAQAVQDYGVGIVVGDEQTYGKGTIQSQTVTDNESSSFFKVTVGKYYTVSGQTPQLRGVKADIVVPGQFDDEKIGEEYLEYPLAHDTVTPAYEDTLSDVDEGLKPWYLRYYMPSLQERETTWNQVIPALRKKSEERVNHDPEYKRYIAEEGEWSLFKMDEREGDDPQMSEAVNIIKDMIDMETKIHALKADG